MAVPNVTVARSSQLVKPVPLLEGTRTDPAGKAVRNVILLSVPDDEYELIRPHLELLELPRHFVMHEQGEKLDFAYFPNEGMVSLVILVKDGKSVEVGLVGKEGMTGTPLAVGVSRAPFRAIVQIPGSGLRLPAETLETILPLAPEFKSHLNRYILTQGPQIAYAHFVHMPSSARTGELWKQQRTGLKEQEDLSLRGVLAAAITQ